MKRGIRILANPREASMRALHHSTYVIDSPAIGVHNIQQFASVM